MVGLTAGIGQLPVLVVCPHALTAWFSGSQEIAVITKGFVTIVHQSHRQLTRK